MNRRRMLLTIGGIGSVALLARLLGSRGSSAMPTAESTATAEANVIHLEVASAESQLAFDPVTLTAPAGQQVSLTFRNTSEFFTHNWVLVNGDETVVEQVLQESTEAGVERNHIPQDTSHLIAYTELVPSGESATVTFTTPSAGEYTFLCTFPGHCLAGMRGTFIVTA
jgi:azurin